MKITLFVGLLALLMVGAGFSDTSAVPPLINYQGTLTDESGAPVNGTRKLEFSIYDAPIGGNRVWGPQIFASVPVIQGRFNVILGSTDSHGKLITDAMDGADRYLSMMVGGEVFADRQRLLSSPFALQAENARYADQATNADHAEHCLLADNATASDTTRSLPEADYDSGWFYVTHSNRYEKEHSLGVLPSLAVIWGAEDARGSKMHLIDAANSRIYGHGGCRLLDISNSHYTLLTEMWRPVDTDSGNGYVKVLMWK